MCVSVYMFDSNQRRLKKVTRLVDKLLCELFGAGTRQLQPRQYDVQISVAYHTSKQDERYPRDGTQIFCCWLQSADGQVIVVG